MSQLRRVRADQSILLIMINIPDYAESSPRVARHGFSNSPDKPQTEVSWHGRN